MRNPEPSAPERPGGASAERGCEPRWVSAERRLLGSLRACGHRPAVAVAARGLSLGGEHGALWLAAGLAGAAFDRPRRSGWLRGTALIAGAHLASMGVKRLVRRPRPAPETYEPLVRTAGRHSFPSSHATSAAAAAVAFGALHPAAGRLAAPLAGAMCLSRLVVGVHHPSDVAAGALLGAATAVAGRRLLTATRARGDVPT
ncbi:phosphatase PAP2 family protein [Streptomyces sp. NPDC004284]|uniref:phosphatase PAP2 family protein n=1 Tax=Streptomyces sp. NPDC004284 TaxID=3364695 RepID=UPI0036A6B245